MAKIKSFGVRVFIDGVSVGALTDASISGVDVTFIDTTTHDTSDEHKEYVSGLLDSGTLELSGKFDAGNAGQLALQGGAGNVEPFLAIKSDNSGFTFTAVVGGYSITNPLDDAVEFSASAKISGATSNAILLDPPGANNGILLTGATKSASIVIAANSTALTVVETTGNAVITSGDKRVMRIGGTLTVGTNPLTIPELVHDATDDTWKDEPSMGFSPDFAIFGASENWSIFAEGSTRYTSADLADFPDQVATWTPAFPATGTPTVTAHPATAAQAIAAINAEEIGSSASNAPGSDGTGFIAALPTTPQQ